MVNASQHFNPVEPPGLSRIQVVESFQLRKQITTRQETLVGEHASLGMWETVYRHNRVVKHGNSRNVSWKK
jgi:hypothetical protein